MDNDLRKLSRIVRGERIFNMLKASKFKHSKLVRQNNYTNPTDVIVLPRREIICLQATHGYLHSLLDNAYVVWVDPYRGYRQTVSDWGNQP